jgi:hypothetical protein
VRDGSYEEVRGLWGEDFVEIFAPCCFALTLTLRFARVRCAAIMFILCSAAKNEPRKRAKGFNTPWIPAMRHEKLKLF